MTHMAFNHLDNTLPPLLRLLHHRPADADQFPVYHIRGQQGNPRSNYL